MSNTPQSVDRALRILLSFDAEGQERSIGELALLLGVHKSTASRLTASLRNHGLLERNSGNDRFRLGPELARLGLLALAGRDLIEVARRPMNELAVATGETVTLSIFDGGELTTVAQVDSSHIIGTRNWIGRSTPLYASSDGKVILAYDGAPLPNGTLAAVTSRTITRRTDLRRELAAVRERGWAEAIGELEDGLHGIAAPVIDAAGRCRAALSVSGPSYRVTLERLPAIAHECMSAAARIGSTLAGSATPTAAGGDGRAKS
jgi:DNA-binding IclR family transcriptional regulator